MHCMEHCENVKSPEWFWQPGVLVRGKYSGVHQLLNAGVTENVSETAVSDHRRAVCQTGESERIEPGEAGSGDGISNLTDMAYRKIKAMMMNYDIVTGQRLIFVDLAKRLG